MAKECTDLQAALTHIPQENRSRKDTVAPNLTKAQIGRCGELLVQYVLLKYGIESAPMTTDRGIDLIAFPNVRADPGVRPKPITIQVKTTSYGDGQGIAWNEGVVWTVSDDCPADYMALVDKSRDRFWLFPKDKFQSLSIKAGAGRRLGWNVKAPPRRITIKREEMFCEYYMDSAVPALFTARGG